MIALNRAKLFAVGVTAVVFILSSLAAETFGGDKWVAELVSEDSDCVILHQLSTDNPSTVTLTIPETLRAEDFATPLVIKGVTDKMVKPAQEKEYRVVGINLYQVFPACERLVLPENLERYHVNVDGFPLLKEISSPNGKYFTSVDGVLYAKDMKTLMHYPPYRDGAEYAVPEPVVIILDSAFKNSARLKKVILPPTLEAINPDAFANCVLLSEVSFPERLSVICRHAFWGAGLTGTCKLPPYLEIIDEGAFCKTKIDRFEVPENSQHYEAEDGVLFSKDMKVLQCYPGGKEVDEYVVPESVETVAERAFADCENLTKVVLPKGLKHLCPFAFAGCPALTLDLNLPSGLETIGDFAFWSCKSLSGELVIPEGILEIPTAAFDGCSKIEKVTLPKSLKKIGDRAFGICASLSGELVVPDDVRAIGAEAFCGCNNLTRLVLPQNLEQIERQAFWACSSLNGELKLPPKLMVIYKGAFQGCSSITGEIRIPKSVRLIEGNAFSYCPVSSFTVEDGNKSYKTVDGVLYSVRGDNGEIDVLVCYPSGRKETKYAVPDGVTSIGVDAFRGCLALEEVKFPKDLDTIGQLAFAGCQSLKGKMELPDKLVFFGEGAFCHTQIDEFQISGENESFKTVDGVLFEIIDGEDYGEKWTNIIAYPCGRKQKEYAVPEGTDVINERAFADCPYLEKITLPKGILGVESWAFAACGALKEINLPEGMQVIGDHAFWNAAALPEITLPDSLRYIDKEAFKGCGALKRVNASPKLNMTYRAADAFESGVYLDFIKVIKE